MTETPAPTVEGLWAWPLKGDVYASGGIRVRRETPDRLRAEEWCFWVTHFTLTLSRMEVQRRASARHKFKTTHKWEGYVRRDRESQPEIPAAVVECALDTARAALVLPR